MATLSLYLEDLTQFLRDANYQFSSKKQLTRWVNEARRKVAQDTGCIQCLVTGQSPFGTSSQPGYFIPGAGVPGMLPGNNPNNLNAAGAVATASNGFNTIPGVEVYPFTYINQFLRQQYAGVNAIHDVFNVSVSWGGIRPTLNWLPWDDLQAYARSYNIGAFAYPFGWATLGIGEAGQVWLFPVPSTALPGEMEVQASCTPIDLYTDDDYDAVPHPFQSCVKFYAAYLSFLSTQRLGQAETYKKLYEEKIISSTVASDRGHIPNYYYFEG